MTTISSLISETAVYGVTAVISRSLTLLLLPVLTNLLPPQEYGHLRLAFLLISILQIFFVFGMGTSLIRHYLDSKDIKAVFNTHFWPLFVTSSIGAAAIYLLSDKIAGVYFAEHIPSDAVLIRYSAIILWLDAINLITFSYLRAKGKPFTYLIGTLCSVIVYFGLVIYLLAFREYGLEGVLIANCAGSATTFVIFIPLLIANVRFRFDRAMFPVYLAFGLPIIFSSLGKSLLDFSDRWILDRISGAETVAFYSAGYQLGAVANLAVAAFILAWKPFLVRASKSPEAQRVFSRVMSLTVGFLCLLLLAVSLYADNIVAIRIKGFNLIDEAYWSGLVVVPLVMIGYIFYGIYINLGVGCDLKGKTIYYAITTGTAAALNVILNLILIPKMGMMGAAWATVIAYVVQAAFLFILTRKIYPVAYDWPMMGRLFAVALAVFWATVNFSGDSVQLESVAILAYVAYMMYELNLYKGLEHS